MINMIRNRKESKLVIGIIGNFAIGKNVCDGQTIKTRMLNDELIRIYGKDNVIKVDTYQHKKKAIKVIYNTIKVLSVC